MPTVFVSENIGRIEAIIESFKQELCDMEKRKEEIKTEMIRMEGCHLVFKGFEDAGIERIIPENEKPYNNQEHLNSIQESNGEQEQNHESHCEQEQNHESHCEQEQNHESHCEQEQNHESHGEHEQNHESHGEHEQNHESHGEHEQNHRFQFKHEQNHDKTPIEELYAKYRTM
jgi:hypothetical protein